MNHGAAPWGPLHFVTAYIRPNAKQACAAYRDWSRRASANRVWPRGNKRDLDEESSESPVGPVEVGRVLGDGGGSCSNDTTCRKTSSRTVDHAVVEIHVDSTTPVVSLIVSFQI